MKRLLSFIALCGMPLVCIGQFQPQRMAAYVYSDGAWAPATSSSTTGATSNQPQGVSLYCLNTSTGDWVPATAECFGAASEGSSVSVNGGSDLPSVNLNGATPAAGSGFQNLAFQVDVSGNTSVEAPLSSSSVFGVAKVDNTTIIAGSGTVSVKGAAGEIIAGASPALTATPALGTDGSVVGTLQLSNASASAHTIWGSGATTSNTIKGFAAVPTSGDLVSCTTASTTCTLTDSGVAASAVALAASLPIAGALTYTTATSDTATIAGVTSSSHCTFSPTNAAAASTAVVGYISGITTNSVTITHAATVASGGTVDIICTVN